MGKRYMSSKSIFTKCIMMMAVALSGTVSAQQPVKRWRAEGNPIIRHKFTADPAPFVKGDTLYL